MRAGAAIDLSSRRKPPPCADVFMAGVLALKIIDAGVEGGLRIAALDAAFSGQSHLYINTCDEAHA